MKSYSLCFFGDQQAVETYGLLKDAGYVVSIEWLNDTGFTVYPILFTSLRERRRYEQFQRHNKKFSYSH